VSKVARLFRSPVYAIAAISELLLDLPQNDDLMK